MSTAKFLPFVAYVTATPAGQYGVDYTTNVYTNPAFGSYPAEKLERYLASHNRTTTDGEVTVGGCLTWRPEEFLESVAGEMDLADAWLAVFAEEDNFVRQAFGLRKGEKVKVA